MAEMASSTGSKDYAVILNNFKNDRAGGENDDKHLVFVFVDKLGFHHLNGSGVSEDLKRNLTKAKWTCGGECNKECIQCLIKQSDIQNCKSFLFAVCSHGQTDENGLKIQFMDGVVYLHEIISYLQKCKSLEGKTVIVIIEACRSVPGTPGPIEDPGVHVPVEGSGDQAGATTTPNVLPPEETFNKSTDVPNGFMILFATTPFRYSYRDQIVVGSVPQGGGSWFVTDMKNVIEEKKKDETVNLLDFFTEVARKVAGRSAKGSEPNVDANAGCTVGKCVPCLEHRITNETDIKYTVK